MGHGEDAALAARHGARVTVIDRSPRMLARAARRLYFGAAVLTFRVLVGTPLHPLYDYTALLPEAGLRLEECREFRVLGGPAFYRTLVATRL